MAVEQHTFPGALVDTFYRMPDRMALALLDNERPARHVTYRDLLLHATGYAQALASHLILPGEVVILILQHGLDLVCAFCGAALHGAVPSIMPFLTEKLDPEQYRHSLKSLFEITRPAVVITYPEFVAEARQAAEDSSVRLVLTCDQVTPADSFNPGLLAGLECSPQDILLLQHSSGTTGLQKGVALSHQAVFNQLAAYAEALHLQPEDVVVSWLPLYHDMGLIAGFLLPLLERIPLVLLSPFDWVRAPYRLLQAVSEYRGTLSWLPNFAFNFCAQKIRPRDLQGVDLSSWRAVSNCSEPMHSHSHQVFLERFRPYGLRPSALTTCYAMAENVFAVTQGGIDAPVRVDTVNQAVLIARGLAEPVPAGHEQAISLLSAGQPIPNTQVQIVDKKHRLLPERQIGEIALRSDCMLSGYYHRPDLTRQAFHDGWYQTGDLGYMVEGEVFVTGRKKDLIIVGGKNIYPQDLERLAGEVPGIHPGRAVAFGIYNDQSGTEDVALVAESDLDEEEYLRLEDAVRQQVNRGSDVVLRYVRVVGRGWLLKTSSGKIARSANRDKYLAEN